MNKLPIVDVGSLRHLVHIQLRSQGAVTGTGSPTSVWTTQRTTFANISTAGMKEAFQSGTFSSQVTHIITIRANPGQPEIQPGMRVVFGQHVYIIQAVDNVQMRSVVLNLLCLEVDGGQ